jgi:hypothetical protein
MKKLFIIFYFLLSSFSVASNSWANDIIIMRCNVYIGEYPNTVTKEFIYKLENKYAYMRTKSGWSRLGRTNDGTISNSLVDLDFEFKKGSIKSESYILTMQCR